MKSYKSFKIIKVTNDFFLQFIKTDKGLKTYIDFYFYINNLNKNYIVERQLLSNVKDPKFALHILKKIIFPIRKHKNFKIIYTK